MKALGMIETIGLVGAIEAADTALKTAEVEIVNRHIVKGGIVTVELSGDVGAIKVAVEAMKLNAIDFISKPFTPEQIRMLVKKVFLREELEEEKLKTYEDYIEYAKLNIIRRKFEESENLLKIAIGRTDIEKIPINIIMTRMPNIIYAEENETILESVKKLIKHQIDSLPVVRIEEKNGKKIYHTVGRLTKTNITKLFMETLSNN